MLVPCGRALSTHYTRQADICDGFAFPLLHRICMQQWYIQLAAVGNILYNKFLDTQSELSFLRAILAATYLQHAPIQLSYACRDSVAQLPTRLPSCITVSYQTSLSPQGGGHKRLSAHSLTVGCQQHQAPFQA